MKIDTREIQFDPASVADPNGKVFWWQGGVYRAIKGKSVDLYKSLFTQGIIEKLNNIGLIETEITDLSLADYELVLKHRTIPFRAYPFEWCDEMLKDAALLTCDLNLALVPYNLSTQDAHCWNILFDGSVPKFVDFGSIVPKKIDARHRPLWYKEFQDFFLYPLYLMSDGQGDTTRRLLFDLNNYVGKQDIVRFLPKTRQLQYGVKEKFHNWTGFQSVDAFLRNLRCSIEGIEFPVSKTDWSGYYDNEFPTFEPSDDWSLKHRTVFEILKKLHPKSVADIGSNRGWYSQLATSMGIPVVAFDTDEASVKSLYMSASREKLPLLPLIMDICRPSPACTGVKYNEYYPAAQDRIKSELVLALAIVHHLVFKQGLRFERIVEILASFTTKWLLVEFVPPTDRYVSAWYSDQFSWYSTCGFIAELGKVFHHVEVFDSFPSPRILLLCER